MKNFEKFLERLDSRPYGGCDCEEFLKNVYQDRNYECPSYDCYVCLEKPMKYLNEEYVEPIKLTHDEYVILKNLHSNIKWIARNENGDVKLFTDKPCKYQGCNCWSYKSWEYLFYLYNDLFQFIKWEDEEPYEIAKLIEDYEKEHEDDN